MKAKILFGLLIGTLALAGTAMGVPGTLAYDEAGNYTPAIFVNGANLGTGFGAWDLWNKAAELGNSTDGGGGDLNSTNGYSFRFMGDGAGGWCNGKRNFDGALQEGNVLSFTFTYNYDGGGRGVDIFCSTGQFANLIDVSPGDTFKVNGETISTEWSLGAVVEVEITQQADGIQVHLTRATNGTENLNYTTNILNPEPASGFSLYCGGYTCDPGDNVNYAIFMNDIEIVGEPRLGLSFTSGTWDPAAIGVYEFVLSREGAVGDDIVLTSSNTNSVTVPPSVSFEEGSNSVSFNATVVSLTAGTATIVASNTASGAWAEYGVTPVAPVLTLSGPWEVFVLGFATYTLERSASVDKNIILSSSDTNVLTVEPDLEYAEGSYTSTFTVAVSGYGSATITASDATSGAWATYDVTVAEPKLELTGPATAWEGDTKTYTVTRLGPVNDTVNLSSTDTNVMTVPASVTFPFEQNWVTFQAVAVAMGGTMLSADNDDVEPATLAVTVTEVPNILAYDEAGNYTPATFISTANEGYGFGEWNLWGEPASLGDSTAGGGGDLNSTNGYSFRFMGDGAGGWCNGTRYFDGALQQDDVLSFTFTYNYDGGQRGVDIFCSTGQFANLIDVSPGDTFKVNGETISTNYSPAAVVDVEITQQTNGIQMSLVRSVGGTPNLTYTTNILNPEPANGVSMYCGGYTADPIENNVNFAVFMNDLQIVGEERTSLTFTGGTWNPSVLGDYPFELTRVGAVDNEIVLTSDNEAAVTVPASVTFAGTGATVSFNVTVVSLTAGDATIIASNVASGMWAEYTVRPVAPMLTIGGPWLVESLGAVEYTLTRAGAVGTNILLSSSDTNVLGVPADLLYGEGSTETTFPATALAYGTTTITATDTVSGAWATYGVTVQIPTDLPIPDITFVPASGNFTFAEPDGYDLYKVYGADFVPNAIEGWDWVELVRDTDYTVVDGVVTILTDAAARQIIRVSFIAE